MDPSNVILYENSLLKYYAMKRRQMLNKKKQNRKRTNPIYLGKFSYELIIFLNV